MTAGRKQPDDTYGERKPRIVRGEKEVVDVGGRKFVVRKAGLGNEVSSSVAERLESDYKRMTEDGDEEGAEEEPTARAAAPEPGEPGEPEPAANAEPPKEPAEPQALEPPAEPAAAEPTEPAEPAQPAQEPAQAPAEPAEPAASEETVTVPRAEYEELKRGGLRQADYTRKTQAHAAEVKAFADERKAVREERAQYATLIKQLEDTLKTAQPTEPNWAELRRTLPAEEYLAQKEAWDGYQRDLETTRKEQARVTEKATADLRQQHTDRVVAERDKLIALKPELADPAKMKAWLQRLKQTAQTKFGVTEQEFLGAVDHRWFLLLEAASGGAPSGARPVTTKPRVPRSVPPAGPVAARVPQKTVDAARDRMRKEQSVEAVGDYFATMLK